MRLMEMHSKQKQGAELMDQKWNDLKYSLEQPEPAGIPSKQIMPNADQVTQKWYC